MDKIIVRKAVYSDLQTLFEFEQGIVTTERPFDSTLKEGLIHYYDLEAMIGAGDVELLVAECDGELAGSGYARIEDVKDYLKHPQHAYLGFMYVKPEFRGRGVNQMIIGGLKEWCRERHITEMRLEVYDDNLGAIKAYEKAGFKKLLVWMRLGIDS
ncbi:GNAT family N-acetyltransferase [Mucilaginibacter gotjawali]|uniref:GNAT superfamily N-acetyltransferase n=2 Tax=Mucilaginibacter gotjawali TaxID=1550579 RepID=A0A839SI64_9SPHI|nr:GNAT family N-acetyltransferase [Mucilaginibacter gotjawali]MBB3056974.1 GNAT superfamily N-acetyltransferase [Mucilaginibacter gotjawali]BAU56053.1 TDP-fucosamine acetyltransferase [Mucilaginibacter gotjawali]